MCLAQQLGLAQHCSYCGTSGVGLKKKVRLRLLWTRGLAQQRGLAQHSNYCGTSGGFFKKTSFATIVEQGVWHNS